MNAPKDSTQQLISRHKIVNIASQLYGKHTLHADAFRHILAGAYYTTKLGPTLARMGGYLVEVAGSLKVMLKLKGFSSGWKMDLKNNEIGFALGMDHKKASFSELAEKTKALIDAGSFYTLSGKMFREEEKEKNQ